MSMEPSLEIPDATLALAVAGSSGGHMGGVTACAYAGELHVGGKKIDIWGCGGARSVETLNAYGICHALEETLAALPGDFAPVTFGEAFRIHVWAPATGFMRFINVYMPEWDRLGGKNEQGEEPDAYREWRRLWQMANMGKFSVERVTPSQFGLKRVQLEARRIAETAHWNLAFNTVGIANHGTNFETAK